MADVKHKSKNTNIHRFKSFGDRVSEIDIRSLALYHIGHQNEELLEVDETYFHQTLKKWVVLNLSEEFSQFSRKCVKIVTLPQLIHQKDVVIDLLLENLAVATNLSLQPLLELLYVLARDLREEFHAYFQRVLDSLICLLNTTDAEQLEWVLICLAHLFKILKPHLKKNIGVVFHAILPLLDEQRYDEHVINFAVECFSFVVRDIRDFNRFVEFILETVVREQVESVLGCGRLFFEIVRGTKGTFHSIAETFLRCIFKILVDEKNKEVQKSVLLRDIVEHAVLEILKFIHPHNVSLLWTTLCEAAESCKSLQKIPNLMAVFSLLIEYKDGRFVTELDVIIPTLLSTIDKCLKAGDAEALHMMSSLVSQLLLAKATQLTQLDTSRLMKKTLTIEQRDIYEHFIELIVMHPQFEILVLSSLVKYIETHFDLKAIELLAKVILKKRPLSGNAINLSSWSIYPIHVKDEKTLNKFESKLKECNFVIDNNEEQLLLLIIVPHVVALNKYSLQKLLKVESSKILKKIANTEDFDKDIITLSILIEIQLQLRFKIPKDVLTEAAVVLLPHLKTLRVLNCLDQLLTQNTAIFNANINIRKELMLLLSSHSHQIRLTAAHCLSTLHRNNNQVCTNLYKIFFDSESITPTIHTYREQLLHISKLETSTETFKSFNNDARYVEDVLRFLLGMLYHNFKFVWEPVLQLIEEYANVMDVKHFWEIYKEQIQKTSNEIELWYKVSSSENTNSEISIAVQWVSPVLNEFVTSNTIEKLSQQDLFNYRNLLWMRLSQFGKVVEINNRDVVPMFLEFINNEYRKNLERHEFVWNLKYEPNKETHYDVEDLVEEEVNSDDENNDRETIIKKKSVKSLRKTKDKQNAVVKAISQTLQSMLSVFIRQPNPKALFRETELHNFYLELLSGANGQLQKIALDCIMNYKVKALVPYKEHLYAIIDEQKFKDELINLKVKDMINDNYRSEFMEILLRILYGKMVTRGSQRNVGSQVRKGLVLRFMGQCSTFEILWFLQMAFGKFDKYINADTVQMEDVPNLVKQDFDISTVWSPKKLQNVINLLELIRKEFGGLMDPNFLIYMIKLLVFVGSVCKEVLELESSQMHPKIPTVYKNVKNAALLSLVNFFSHIDEFPWKATQIQCLIEVFVWPGIERLSQDSIHSPTALLKLLLQWGEKPAHFGYLDKRQADDKPGIFAHMIELLLNPKAKPAVRNPLLLLIERLLVCTTTENCDVNSEGALNLVKPFIPQILRRLKMNFSTKMAKKVIDKRDLHILSMLTSHVHESDTCDSLLQLLLPVLIAQTQSSVSTEIVLQVITTLTNLINRLDTPEIYLLKVAPLFEYVNEVSARKMLCHLVADIAKKRIKLAKNNSEIPKELCDRLREIGRIMLLVNAWDKRWVEQPDYDKRLDALKEVKTKIESGIVDLDLGVLMIFNCCYFLKYDKDMGLRDNASEHLKFLLPKLIHHFQTDKVNQKFLVEDVCIKLLSRLIRDKNQNVRNEAIRILGEVVRQCPMAHSIFKDLAPLADKDDVEVDFFENMTHLQSHRQGRALLKFCSLAETLTETPNVRTLTQFIMPLASRFLMNEQCTGKHTLVDAAIDAVAVCCQLIPWQQYHMILRFYLMKMRRSHEHSKQSVRIVVRILEAFHFDLSQSKAEEQDLQHLKEELTEKLKLKNTNVEEKKADAGIIKEEDDDDQDGEGLPKEELTIEEELAESSDTDNDDEHKNDKITIPAAEAKIPILNKQLVLSKGSSKRVMAVITGILLPNLNRSITEKSSYDVKHKVNRKRFSKEREEEEILRVPIALAMVKLLQKLPKEILDASVPGIFMKVCTFLRSPLKSVRMLTRDMLKKIMLTLGSTYLALLMDHLQNLLTRGFQVHVLSVTVHGVLDAMQGVLQPIDIENCLNNLLEVALNDIFGEISAEKEIEKISAHTPEAKPSSKSYLVLHIAARNIRENCLLDLLMPFKEHLARSHSRKLILKIQDCFAKIVAGLVENVNISRESLLIFIYGTMSESITDLIPGTQRHILTDQQKESMRRVRPDCYIIQPAPRMRSGAITKQVKSNAQANAHILVEFGLDMLHFVLKRKKLIELNYEPFLNPLLPILKDSLKSTHARVTTFALKCLTTIWVDEYDLPALAEYLDAIVKRIFEILQNFSTFGSSKQEDNTALVTAVFKAVVAVLRKCSTYTFSKEEIDQLVLQVERDLYEGENQATCFPLLKAMIARKVDTEAVYEIMQNVANLCITSQSDYIRDEARKMLITYVMEYTLKKRIDHIVKFFTVQLCFSLPSGRLSAINFLYEIIKKFPQKILSRRAEFLYLSLGSRLVNDDDPECRKAIAECIEQLINRIIKEDRDRLFDMTLLFFGTQQKATIHEMAASLCSRFLNAEKQAFSPRLKMTLPLVLSRLHTVDIDAPGRFVLAPGIKMINIENSEKPNQRKKLKSDKQTTVEIEQEKQCQMDHKLIQLQYCVLKMFDYCNIELLENEELSSMVDQLAYTSQQMLGHEHEWVRCNAAKIISEILKNYDYGLVAQRLCKLYDSDVSNKFDYIYLNPENDIKSLVLDLCAQMVPGETPQMMIDEIVKNFLYIANMLRDVPFEMGIKKDPENDTDQQVTSMNLNWLMRNIRFLINKEVAQAPHCITMRSALFTLMEGFISLLTVESIIKLSPAFLGALVREMSEDDQTVDAELRQQALRVGSRLRKRIGSDIYDKLRTGSQMKLMIRRAERKKLIAQEKIHDPVRAAKRKQGAQERKKIAKKLKTSVMRGKAPDIKQKLKKRKRKLDEDAF